MGSSKRVKPSRLAEKLKTIRESLGLTTEELIIKLNCPQVPLHRASITQYEKGRREPPLPVLLQYARLMNVYVDVLIDDNLLLDMKIPQ
jgi:transcriptional regulator with XRE-family HTH domain